MAAAVVAMRVKDDVACVVFGPEGPVGLSAGNEFSSEDWVVRTHPEYFEPQRMAKPRVRQVSAPLDDLDADRKMALMETADDSLEDTETR